MIFDNETQMTPSVRCNGAWEEVPITPGEYLGEAVKRTKNNHCSCGNSYENPAALTWHLRENATHRSIEKPMRKRAHRAKYD